jgi:16S rRNA (guanine527-N7)-methyltransferase
VKSRAPDPSIRLTREDSSDVLQRAGINVSRETLERLEHYRELLIKWSKAIDLVGPREMEVFWRRHVLDSLQLLALAPAQNTWTDLGSGAGLPGIIIACGQANTPESHVTMVEKNPKRVAFLKTCVRELQITAEIVSGDLTIVPVPNAKVVTARALAPLPTLFDLSYRFMVNGARGLFPKGRDARAEIETAQADGWMFHVKHHQSLSDPDACILEIQELRHDRYTQQPDGSS